MDESDEDIDPIVGPVAELMAEYNLSSTITTDIKTPIETIEILDKKINILDYLSFFNIHLLFQDIFNYILDIRWYHYLRQISPKIEQETFLSQSPIYPSLKKLSLFFLIYAISISLLPFIIHIFFFIYLLFHIIINLFIPLLIYSNWFKCLKTIHLFLNTIQIHQQWLINIHGFQLIRPTSSLFENQLYQFRQKIFHELQKHFLYSRQIAREYSIENEQFICYIDLNEFGPLIQPNNLDLENLTNKYDQPSINSLLKLCHLQINECIQLIHLNRPKSYWLFNNYKKFLLKSIDNLQQTKQNCFIMFDYINLEKLPSKKLISSYFLLRSNCEQLFEMNEKNSLNNEQLKRIIQDLKTVIYSLEAIQSKPIETINQLNSEQILSNENQPSNISSYHRFDDQIQESIDEILVCDTGKSSNNDDEITNNLFDIENYDKQLLREQTNCLMKELQTAIQGKKQEWNEREQRLLGHIEINEPIREEKKEIINDEQTFEKVISLPNTISMLDELKHSFKLNRDKLNINEDIFGEDEPENFDDDDDDDD